METHFSNGAAVATVDFPYREVQENLIDEALRGYINEQIKSEEQLIRQETLITLATKLRQYKNPLFALDCLLFSIASPFLMGESETEIAMRYGVDKAAVSKMVCKMADDLGLKPAGGRKDEEAREKYAERQIKIHEAK